MRGLGIVLVLAGCTVDVSTPADASACAPSPDFFVSDVWPRYLEANLCNSSGCHDFSSGHGYLRLRPPEMPAPAPGTALADWPTNWRLNYLSTIQLLRCDMPDQSRLLTVPEGVGNLHPPGPIVRDRATAASLIESWIAQP